IALRLVDSNGTIENSTFSDNNCGISVDSLVSGDGFTYGGCYGVHSFYSQAAATTTPQIINNQFIKNRVIAIETRNGSTPVIDNNIFTDNGYPVRIESSYPTITRSQVVNSTTSPNILNGIAISGRTHFTQNHTLKKDLPYILETNGPALMPRVDRGGALTIEPGVIFKTGNPNSVLGVGCFNCYYPECVNCEGHLITQGTAENLVVFTSIRDDTRGGDTNGDGSASSPQDGDWGNIRFNASSTGALANTNFYYGTVDNVSFPNNPNLPATSLISQCSEAVAPDEYSFDAGSKIAFSFTSLSDVARGIVAVSLRKASSSPGSLRIAVETDFNDSPSGGSLSLTDIDQSSLAFTFKNFKLPFGVGIGSSSGLVANATYWVVVENIGGPDDQFYIKNSEDDTCPAVPKFWDSSNGWSESVADIVFKADKIEYFLPIIVDAGAMVVVQ
ncbi:MAG: right-handed parallel beta-helix repeat-containing protein, partial [Patescibacteria group bacterium]